MNDIDKLLEYVQKTNPRMTKERLIEELNKYHCSAAVLIMLCENNEKAYNL